MISGEAAKLVRRGFDQGDVVGGAAASVESGRDRGSGGGRRGGGEMVRGSSRRRRRDTVAPPPYGRPARDGRRSASVERSTDCEASDERQLDFDAIVNGLNQYLRLRSIPIGMKLFETGRGMEASEDPPAEVPAHDRSIVAQARQLGWTVGITM